jgi:hypothetical protein
VETVDVDLESDRLQVYYDPAKVTTQDFLHTVEKQGFSATVVAVGGPAGSKAP